MFEKISSITVQKLQLLFYKYHNLNITILNDPNTKKYRDKINFDLYDFSNKFAYSARNVGRARGRSTAGVCCGR